MVKEVSLLTLKFGDMNLLGRSDIAIYHIPPKKVYQGGNISHSWRYILKQLTFISVFDYYARIVPNLIRVPIKR
jgi:hypothetical protein